MSDTIKDHWVTNNIIDLVRVTLIQEFEYLLKFKQKIIRCWLKVYSILFFPTKRWTELRPTGPGYPIIYITRAHVLEKIFRPPSCFILTPEIITAIIIIIIIIPIQIMHTTRF